MGETYEKFMASMGRPKVKKYCMVKMKEMSEKVTQHKRREKEEMARKLKKENKCTQVRESDRICGVHL